MEFIYVNKENEEESENHKYYVRAYGERRGNFISNLKSIRQNCLIEKKYCLVEKKTKYYKLFWDLDFKEEMNEEIKTKHEKITKYIIKEINEGIDKIIKDANKDYVYSESTKGLGKHLNYINIIVDVKLHKTIYNEIIKNIKKDKKYEIEVMEKIIDKSICVANGLRLFGCIHNGGYYYPVKEKSTHKITGNIEDDFEYCLLNTSEEKYNCELKNDIDDTEEVKEIKKREMKEVKEEISNNDKIDDVELKKIKELLEIIKSKNKKYNNWLKVGMALNTTNKSKEMMEVWYKWSSYNYDSNESEIKEKWESFKNVNNPLTIKTIMSLARNENYELYIEWYNKYNKKEIVNLVKDFDQHTVSIYFKNKKPENYVYKNSEWYYVKDNNLWKKMNKKENSKLINDITDTIKEELVELKNNLKPEDELLKLIPSTSKRLGTSKFILGVIDYLKDKYTNESVEFDNKSNLFGFENVVYDLEKNEFRNYLKEDMITITTGYDWIEPKEEEIMLINDIINKIHTKRDIRKFYLDILTSGLWGITMQYFIIFNGSGSNGKSMFDDLMMTAVGNYGHTINSIVLCEQRKQGACCEIASMHKKRILFAREPPKKQNVKLSNSLIRELTGGSKISARQIYSENENTELCLTLIMECNDRPLLEEDPTEADERRIIDLLFESKFKDEEDKENNKFKKNMYYITNEFREKYKYALLKILFEHNEKNYKKDLIKPQEVAKRTKGYMESSIEIFEWFNETFEKIEKYKDNDYVSMTDINTILKESEYYETLSKNDKRKLTREKLIKLFKENAMYKNYYKDELNTHEKGKKIKIPKRLVGFKIKK